MLPPIANNFVAGETPAEALAHTREYNEHGIGVILNLLGEHYDARAEAAADRDAYLQLIEDIAAEDLQACISVKPSQIGLDVDPEYFETNLTAIVEHATLRDVFVWVDMEDHTTTDTTIDAFEPLAREHGTVGLCLQANLQRTREDLERLVDVPGKLRLVKGAYDEPADISYSRKERVNAEYRELLRYAFEHRESGVAVGSHDPAMIEHAQELHERHGTDFEIQMLMGVRESAQIDLAEDCTVWQYAPYGDRWLSYFYRRVMERKENALFAARAVLGRS
ncbi:proline dehydrogenase family protein [Natranaeroarchaeum sulfidigenes]|uniref:proline dehydrogenase n=1 Tax=Natranaeroarchaeum sulfidigenes TaxID=2784880 RepID=A0A897MSK1_9EURY|nr:proline dehydrogenase family protein [Natranaeroarchaeum sulfidigenes]QSG01993.1 Proline dehydrogenase [Natranaeroarchaeum sulfidigenes]